MMSIPVFFLAPRRCCISAGDELPDRPLFIPGGGGGGGGPDLFLLLPPRYWKSSSELIVELGDDH